MKRGQRTNSDKGAALATVLTMLAIMSTLAIFIVDMANMAVRRTSNLVRMEQTRWYLIGAEAFAVSQLEQWLRPETAARIDAQTVLGRTLSFPLDDGTMDVALWDGANCFNLNSVVVTGDGGERSINAGAVVQFARLLDALGLHQANSGNLAPALVDWIDTDMQALPGGAEAEPEVNGRAPYRPANALLADISELQSIRGFSPEIVQRLRPYVCVRPTSAPNQLNPNTLTPEQAPLLAMAIGGVSIERAAQMIRERPRGGWEDVDDFLRHRVLNDAELNEAGRAQFSLRSRYFVVTARVQRLDSEERSASLLEVDSAGRATVLRRLFGAGGGGNPL